MKVDAIVFIQVMERLAGRLSGRQPDVRHHPAVPRPTCAPWSARWSWTRCFSQRDQINTRLLSTIDHATGPWGVKVARIEIKDLTPPADITNAMARQMKAERERRAVITEAEGEKQAQIARAEGQKQSAILQAEGRREAAFRDAEAREREAEAEAKATAFVSEAISKGDVNAINYFIAQKYVEAFGDLARSPNAKTVIVPADFAGLTGTVAGVAELVKTLGGNEAAARRRSADPQARSLTPWSGLMSFYATHPFWVWLAVAAIFLAVEVATGTGWLLWPAAVRLWWAC